MNKSETPEITLKVPALERSLEVVTEGENLVINTTTTQTVSKTADRETLSKLHRETLETYATNLSLDLDFNLYATRGELIEAILNAREEA